MTVAELIVELQALPPEQQQMVVTDYLSDEITDVIIWDHEWRDSGKLGFVMVQ